nr:phospholipase SGR2 isoform X1 [Nicotiana tomentosiformis]XP_009625729.1 phospholipase SGR2 isoform X1 [Nicotiana tomentosiformis]XP_018633305.1 phospholipase SGR2 isoform X1 [Nicotiana tomentosiformis]XP_033517288.1 phospholipase SGR2 isoform X1 [Nicotiana tomentosiformis]XP_033517289.1 phospholipase SGR2 isoform X1 [Nicotiana tomentosiformis]
MASVSGSKGGVVDETSPDLLKNTPSNIRRLADEIEHLEGRQKYLAQTTSPSDGGDVRWYFCKLPLAVNQPAAAVPQADIVGKGDYFRFGMRDSLAVEASFLQREDELLSCWWKEYAECSEGPKGASDLLSPASEKSSSESSQLGEEYSVEEERVGVPVKGGLYEVDLVKRHCFPVYWTGENRRVLRGHWFARKGGLDWLPLREDVAEQLEFAYRSKVWHRRSFQPSGLYAARIDMQGFTPGLHAIFTGEDDTWEAWLNADASGFSSAMGFGGNGVKLRRGYAPPQSSKPTQDELRQQKEEEMDDYCSQVPVRHLVFMVHGIGQRLEKSNLVDDVSDFRHITSILAERHLTPYQRGTQRVLFIPCQWRKGLKLSGETTVEKITLDGVRGLREVLSATVHDVLYYMSPIYCQAIIDSVSNQLNKLYLKFLKRNPGYSGKISLYGHSLGSVLSYDILCHQIKLSSPFPMEWLYKEQNEDKSSQQDQSNLSFDHNSASRLDDESFTRGENKSNLSDKDKMKAEPSSSDPLEACTEDFCHPVGPPASSDSDEPVATDDFKQSNDSSATENSREPPIDWTHNIYERDTINDAEKMEDAIVEFDQKTIDEGASESDKDRTINSLREEIDMLRAKIQELESEYVKKENGGINTVTRNQSTSERLSHEESDSPKSYTPQIKYTKLKFKVDTYFAVGSPLGVFLSLRNARIGIGKGNDYWEEDNILEEMPACRQMFNIFHPCDPVAYRLEPLVCKEYLNKRPVIIPYHRGGKRLHIGFQEFKEEVALRSQAFANNINFVKVKVITLCQSRYNDGEDEESQEYQEKEERSYGSIMMERLTGSEDGRIDHVLQDKTFRHAYISTLGAHT